MIPMTDEDFYNYYDSVFRQLACPEDLEIHQLFPTEAAVTEEGKQKALLSLVRFVKSGLAEFDVSERTEKIFHELKDAPLNLPPYPDEYASVWMGNLICGTDKLFAIAAEIGVPDTWSEEPLGVVFKAKLSKIFSDAGVGFDQDISY